jgi:hypothetical protein
MKRIFFIVTVVMALLPNVYSQTGKRPGRQTPPATQPAGTTTATPENSLSGAAGTGQLLPAGGGEPGKALVQYMTALANARTFEETMRVILNSKASTNTQINIDEAKMKTATATEKEITLDFVRTFIIIQDVKVTGGVIAKDRATLNVIGAQDKDEVAGEVTMHLEGGQWKVGQSSVSPTGKKRK